MTQSFPTRRSSDLHDALGGALRAHGADRVGRRTDENDTRVGAGLCKVRIFGEKPVAWMNRFRTAGPCNVDQALDAEIAVTGRRGTNAPPRPPARQDRTSTRLNSSH